MGAASDEYDCSRRRASNESRRAIFGMTHHAIRFVCECDRPSCYEPVVLHPDEYDAVRPAPICCREHRVP